MSVKVIGFERLKDDYESCLDFGELYTSLSNAPRPILDDYTLQDGYMIKASKLCIPWSSVRDFLVWEVHVGDLAGHFDLDKTIEEVERQFYWLGLKKGIAKIVGQCCTCQLAKIVDRLRSVTPFYTQMGLVLHQNIYIIRYNISVIQKNFVLLYCFSIISPSIYWEAFFINYCFFIKSFWKMFCTFTIYHAR